MRIKIWIQQIRRIRRVRRIQVRTRRIHFLQIALLLRKCTSIRRYSLDVSFSFEDFVNAHKTRLESFLWIKYFIFREINHASIIHLF